jgi:hypothetical protein
MISSRQHNSNSALLRLPAEIRNQIYKYVIGRHHYEMRTRCPSGITYYLIPGSASSPPWREQKDLSQTCRQLHHETSVLALRNNIFWIDCLRRSSILKKWMGLLQPYEASAIQSISLSLSAYADRLKTLKTLLSNFSGIKEVRVFIYCSRNLDKKYQQVLQAAGFKLRKTRGHKYLRNPKSKTELYQRS